MSKMAGRIIVATALFIVGFVVAGAFILVNGPYLGYLIPSLTFRGLNILSIVFGIALGSTLAATWLKRKAS